MTSAGAGWIDKAAALVALADPGNREPPRSESIASLPGYRRFREIVSQVDNQAVALEKVLGEVGDRDLFYLFAYHPTTVVEKTVPLFKTEAKWSIAVNLYEAWWRLAALGQLARIEPRGQRTATAYFARTRWLLYSLPFRYAAASGIDSDDRSQLGPVHRLVTRARDAREDWLAVLDDIEDHSLLAQDIDAEREARYLLDCRVNHSQLGGCTEIHDPIDVAVWRHCVRRHLLPRFATGAAWRLALRLGGPIGWTCGVVAGLAFAAAVAMLVLGFGPWRPGDSASMIGAATVLTVCGYGAVLIAGVRERTASWPWLMRQPASAALGAVTLVALHPAWWQVGGTAAKLAATAALAVAAVGYLAFEASNHRVPGGWKLIRRVAGVSGLGSVHAVLVSAAALRWLVPAISEQGADMAALWSDAEPTTGTPPAWPVVLLAASWCFAAGVFSQILWDEQPFTAPLAHLGWRRGR